MKDNNFRVIPFCDPGYNTSDIQQLTLNDGGYENIGYGEENFSIWEGVPTVVVGSEYVYWIPSMDMTETEKTYYWGDGKGNKVAFSIAPAQGIVVNSAADLSANTAGQVPTKKVSFTTVKNNNFTGNPFPSEIDIQAISISTADDAQIGYGEENFSIWEGVPTVVAGSEYVYWDPSMDITETEKTYYCIRRRHNRGQWVCSNPGVCFWQDAGERHIRVVLRLVRFGFASCGREQIYHHFRHFKFDKDRWRLDGDCDVHSGQCCVDCRRCEQLEVIRHGIDSGADERAAVHARRCRVGAAPEEGVMQCLVLCALCVVRSH